MQRPRAYGQGRVGYRALLRENRNFRALWLADTASLVGDWFTLIASASLIGQLGGSGLAIGGMFMLRMLAPFVTSPLGGLLADRRSRRGILIATDLARAAVVLAFLLVRDPGDVWLVYLLTFVQLGLSGIFVPARGAILADVVSPAELGTANALCSATYAAAQTLGAAAGGLSAQALGVYQTFLVDAASFLLSAALCARIRVRRSTAGPAVPGPVQRVGWRAYVQGLRHLGADLEALFIVLHKGANCLFIAGGLNVVVVAIATQRFADGAGGGGSLGLLFCATGVGTALGPLLARRFTQDREPALRLGLLASYLISAAGLGLTATLAGLPVVLAGITLRGVGGGMLFVFSTQLLLLRVPSGVQGRVLSAEFALRTAGSAAGMAAVSAALDSALGLAATVWWMAGLALLPAGLWALWLLASPAVNVDPAVRAQLAESSREV